MTIHIIRRTTTTTTTTSTIEVIPTSRLNERDKEIYNRTPSPYPTPHVALERKIERIARYLGIPEEEATELWRTSNV